MYDLLIRGGTLVDGTGAPARTADIAIEGDRIVAVAEGPDVDLGPARRTIDAEGLLVTPGWVDIHTHYDGQVTWDPYLSPSGWNGVTTVVMGNCGVGFAPVHPGQEDYLIQLMEGVEDIPGSALTEGIDWKWESFPEYLDALEQMPRALDVAAQIPHGAIRTYVMGERGAKNEKAEAHEIAEMARIVREGLEAGALGFSTSRTLLHRAKDGEVVPGTYAEDEEVMGIGRMLGEVGYGVFEVASDLAPEGPELQWMSQLGKETGRPVTFACLQNPLDGDQWQRLLEIVDRDAAEGGNLTPQVAQRPAGLIFGFDSSLHPFRLKPSFFPLAELSSAERLAALQKPEVRAAILDEEAHQGNIPGITAMVTSAWNMMYPMGTPPNYEPDPEDSIAARAEAAGVDPAALAYDLMLEGEFLYMPFLGYAHGDLEDIRTMMQHEKAVFGLSDGGAHCGLITDASVPTFLLTYWVRDRKKGERFPLEWIVQQQTQKTAAFYGMDDRGVVAAGMKADLNVIDFEALHIHPPQMVSDLPASGRRLIQQIDGYRYTVKSGEITYEDGEPTGAMPGQLVRGPQAAPTA
ncbi:MAG: D-aminoacylase [Deltaproteobacteria bacterium]|jgi:N-acyl-D-aspartate/D-glutamate deacylase|nr:D-aminoacylase [Deltaproteobacteria bacterium]MBW2498874.1 D-aminoacylase [Deltaproteobacteria bacterium]